jgi:thioredoxin-related protein
MKKTAFVLVVLVVIGIGVYSIADTEAFLRRDRPAAPLTWLSFQQGLEESSKHNKKMLVDVYTDWCSWCKKMDKEVYTDEHVIELLKQHFVVVKLNAESSKQLTYNGQKFTEQEFARALGIDGYPTTVFFQADAKPITRIPGFMEAGTFLNVLQYIGEDHYRTTSYQDFLLNKGKTP